jgi:predicted PurR-regulated permease PerM
MERSTQISFLLFFIVLLIVASMNLGTCLLTVLFGQLALHFFSRCRNKFLSASLYLVTAVAIIAGLCYLASRAYRTLPQVADQAIPAMVAYAERNGIDLPFTDYVSLKSTALTEAREGIATVGRYARIASFQSLLVIAGLVIALSIFLNPTWTARTAPPTEKVNVYFTITRELSSRFERLYQSFAWVMGAQLIISAINTLLTAAFLWLGGYPYAPLLICLVFLFGLLPIVGNLISNTMIVAVGFTLSPKTGIVALVFLIVIHKLEYFLNSKIIGKRIDSPVWLTLIALLLGERIMGIPGMIIAPVLLHYIKIEASAFSHRPSN